MHATTERLIFSAYYVRVRRSVLCVGYNHKKPIIMRIETVSTNIVHIFPFLFCFFSCYRFFDGEIKLYIILIDYGIFEQQISLL